MSEPWIHGPLRIRRETLAQIREHARSDYPSEACGFLLGPRAEPDLCDEARPEVNEADKYHARDPETFPRTSREYFKINGLRAQRALEESAASGRPIKVVYHSHCDAGDHFSAEDAATFASEGTLLWPVAFVVLSVLGGQVRSERLWVHRPGTNDFEERALTVVD